MAGAALLTVMREGQTIKTCPIDGEIVLGRAEGCAIRLDHRSVSRQHAIFKSVGDQVQVEKKSEFAQLFVNGAECTRATLKAGDTVSVGPYSITLSQSGPPVSSVSSDSNRAPSADASENPIPELALSEAPANADFGGGFEEAALPALEAVDLPAPQEGQENGLEAGEIAIGESDFASDSAPTLEPSSSEEVPVEGSLPSSEPVDEDAETKILSSGKISVQLVFKPGTANFTLYEVKQDQVLIGRGKDCDVILNDRKASRKNTVIQKAGSNFIVRDLDSINGTYVNGTRVTEQELSGEDTIKVGNVEFQFRATSNEYASQEKDFMSLPIETESPIEAASPIGDPTPESLAAPSMDSLMGNGMGMPTGATGEMAGIPGITGISGGSSKKKTLVDRFKALPKGAQIIVGGIGALFFWWLMQEDAPVPNPAQSKGAVVNAKKTPGATPSGDKAVALGPKQELAFETLSVEQKRFVESQHTLAFDYYKNKDYDKALFEIQKIFTLIPDFKDAREIERYAKEGKRKLEAIEDERHKKEEDAQLKAKIARLVDETKQRMTEKHYDQAKDLFSQILALDPDNAPVATWRKEIDSYEEDVRLKEQQKQVQGEINKRAWEVYQSGLVFKKQRKYHTAIDTFQKIMDMGASDEKLIPLSKRRVAECHLLIKKARDPVLAEAKRLEDAGEFSPAFKTYEKAIRIDPNHQTAYAGIRRIKGVLHERAKGLYTEAVLAESYSDFASAKKFYQDCVNVAPSDDIYHERAQRKLARYFNKEESPLQ